MEETTGLVLTVPNHHAREYGEPPELIAEGSYTGYYENQHGEQMVFQYDGVEKEALLWHGDSSWEEPLPVFAGCCAIYLDEQERQWLRLVWQTATAHESREFHLRSALELTRILRQAYAEIPDNFEFKDSAARLTLIKQIMKLEKDRKMLLQELSNIKEGLS